MVRLMPQDSGASHLGTFKQFDWEIIVWKKMEPPSRIELLT